jgi:RES domain-containing protein
MRLRGIVYRAHNPRWSWPPVSGEGARLHGGRFNRIGVAALYTSLSPVTALREAGTLGHPLQPLLLCAYEIDAEPVFDSLDSRARDIHAVTDADVGCPGWEWDMHGGSVPASQALADRLITAGYVGMRVRSFVPGSDEQDLNLVLWHWGDRMPSRVVLIDDEGRLTR